jgi:hypothetical protein
MKLLNALKLTPAVSPITLDATIEALCTALQCEPSRLRALRHTNWVVVGTAVGASPDNLALCSDHAITLRGPAILFILKDAKEYEGSALEQIDSSVSKVSVETANMIAALLTDGEGQYELQPWPNPDSITAFPSHPDFSEAEPDRRELPEIIRQLSEMLGGHFEVIDLETLGNMQQSAPSIIHGDRAFETYSMDNKLWSDNPPGFKRLLEVPAYATSENGTFPAPWTLVLSMFSFYLKMVKAATDSGQLDTRQAMLRVEQLKKLTHMLDGFRESQEPVKDWPLTSELWSPKEES